MAQLVWGYVENGDQLVRARVDADGSIRTARGALMEDIPAGAWMTRRAVDAILGESDVRTSHSTIALVGPNGGKTDAARAIEAGMLANPRNARVYTLDEIVHKCAGDKADTLMAAIAAFYEGEVEAAA